MPFLNGELFRIGLPMINTFCVDTMLQCRWATPYGKYPNLGELCFATSTEYDTAKAHGASYDVEVMMKSFFKGFNSGFINLKKVEHEIF